MNKNPPTPDTHIGHDAGGFARVIGDPRAGSWALAGLLLLAILTVLYLARALVLPVVIAMVLCLVLLPVVRALTKLGIPVQAGAAVVVLVLVAAFGGGTYRLAGPAAEWLDRAPQGLREVQAKIRKVAGPVQEAAKATEQVQAMTADLTRGKGTEVGAVEVTVKSPTLASGIVASAGEFALSAVVTLMLLYFLLASGDQFLHKTIAAMPILADRKRAADIARRIESDVAAALLTVTAINIALGGLVTLAMYLLNVPNPLLWGVMVGVLNFVPYLGDIASFSVLTMVGLLTFDGFWHGMLVPAVFLVLTATEGYFVTPLVLGRRLDLDPIMIVLSVLFWSWMWGIPGALLAVPILVACKTLCDRVDSLQVVGDFLSA